MPRENEQPVPHCNKKLIFHEFWKPIYELNALIIHKFTFYLQHFTLEVRESATRHFVTSLMDPNRPTFLVRGLQPDTGYIVSIYSSNTKGRSDRMVLQAFTLKNDGQVMDIPYYKLLSDIAAKKNKCIAIIWLKIISYFRRKIKFKLELSCYAGHASTSLLIHSKLI